MSKTAKLASFGLLLASAIGLAMSHPDQGKPGQAQTQRERILTKKTFRNEPVRIISAAYKFSSRVKFGESFIASDDWIPDITFDIQNVSGRTINYIRMEVGLFSSPDLDSPDVFMPINLGKDHVTFETEPVMSLKPGETGAMWRVTPGDVRQAMKDVEQAYSRRLSLDRAEVSISRVIFDDQTMWYHGSLHIRDINNPGVWMNLDILSKPDVLAQYRQYILNSRQAGNDVRKIGLVSPALKQTGRKGFRTGFEALLFGFIQLRSVFKSVYGITTEIKPGANVSFGDRRQGFFDRLHKRLVSSRFGTPQRCLDL